MKGLLYLFVLIAYLAVVGESISLLIEASRSWCDTFVITFLISNGIVSSSGNALRLYLAGDAIEEAPEVSKIFITIFSIIDSSFSFVFRYRFVQGRELKKSTTSTSSDGKKKKKKKKKTTNREVTWKGLRWGGYWGRRGWTRGFDDACDGITVVSHCKFLQRPINLRLYSNNDTNSLSLG